MHIPDGFVSTPIAATTGLASLAALAYSIKKVKTEVKEKEFLTPLIAMLAAFVFAAQMLNFPIGGGTSGHFLGAVAVLSLLGPWCACLALSIVLVIQALLFADGGVTALGANIFNMGFIAGIASYPLMRTIRNLLPAGRNGYLASVAIASWFSIVLASFFCSLELWLSGTSPFTIVMPAMLVTHAIIGIGEALITVSVVSAVITARPDIAPQWSRVNETEQLAAYDSKTRRIAVAGFVIALLLATFASPFASSSPDGLEKVAEVKGFIERTSEEVVVWKDSLLPDYSVPTIQTESLSTGIAGFVGTLFTFSLGYALIRSLTHKRVAS